MAFITLAVGILMLWGGYLSLDYSVSSNRVWENLLGAFGWFGMSALGCAISVLSVFAIIVGE